MQLPGQDPQRSFTLGCGIALFEMVAIPSVCKEVLIQSEQITEAKKQLLFEELRFGE